MQRDGGVCEIRLSRPDLLNRFDNLLQVELASALEQITQDETVRSIVLSSTGKAFSAGGDFALMQAAHDDEEVRRQTVDARAASGAVVLTSQATCYRRCSGRGDRPGCHRRSDV
jgi:enoyl-CoA hydratase/carnithine racemase